VVSAGNLTDGISTAFRVDALLAVAGLLLSLAFIGNDAAASDARASHRWLHRAHA
jgi:hypothetical protein